MIATIILLVLIVGLSFQTYHKFTDTYKFGDFEIKKYKLNQIQETLDTRDIFICDMEKDNCVRLGYLD